MKYVLLTQGQGAQFVYMGKDFHDNFPIFKQTMEEAEDTTCLSIRKWIYEGSQESLSDTDKSQLSIYATTVAIYNVLNEICPFIEFSMGLGLSLGEYSVLTIAKSLPFTEGLKLVRRRGELMQEAAIAYPGRMAAVLGLSSDEIAKHLVGTAVLANLNTPLQTVISGNAEDIVLTTQNLKNNGAKRVVPLDVRGAFHSSLMQPAFDKFDPLVQATDFRKPSFDVIMNANAKPENDPARIKNLLSRQLVSSVLLSDSIRAAGSAATYLELGPGTVVKGLVQKNLDAQVLSVNTVKDLKEFEVCAHS
jgi:[acyl-carrier-protein] S-malonyltransferase